ncbi:glycosyltransferase [Actinacidiphila bryophytorum]|uniref:Vancomycin aglycone glucosyltransferase n=1 Tax=Actinacidiphila bryophytorum TaxID=1436133 RepID=A0A9W4MI20_9ACTN|nr:glycosyltransferase [Actinacidiphila bryophytorum]MBM9435888.1 glycosyltransferase family 1 protein [Actinacidiphila bryophytorum]MBN6547144.1 glycosyltransferase family 1 protein [Actinacidiphila bryophytorum]CAG7649702.1 Vancomycin aglycone glucosyltransferase [Actinacidiphila bryophytorum]
MRVLLSTYGSRGDVEPLAALAVRLRELGAQVRVCAPPDEIFAELLARVGVELVGVGRARVVLTEPSTEPETSQRVTELAAQFASVAAAAEGCDVLLATGLAHFSSRSAAEKLGIPYVYVTFCPFLLRSPYQAPPALLAGQSFPTGVTDNRALWDLNSRTITALHGGALNEHRSSVGLPRVDDVYEFVFTDRPWLASDPLLGPWQETAELDVVHTGAWILPDERPLADDLLAFLDAGTPPVFVGFGSTRDLPADAARVSIEAIRAHGRRAIVGRGWAELARIDDGDDCFAVGEVNQQALFRRVAAVMHHGGAGTTTAAARAGAPQVVVPQAVDQPYWAGRVAALGIGAAHDDPTPTTGSLTAALTTALSPRTLARARAVAGRIRTDGAAEAAQLLLDTATRQRPPLTA